MVPVAVDGLKATGTAILIAAGAIFLVALTWWAAVAVAQVAFTTEILALEVGVVTVLMLLTAAAVWWAFSEGRVSQSLQAGRLESAVRTLMVAAFAVASFASLTSLLYLEGAITISEPVAREDVIFEFQVVYAWHLFDTVPLLDIPQNLRWELPFEFEDSLGGLLLILFTAIVILPLIRVVRAIWTGHREPYEDALRSVLRKNLPDWKTEKLPGKHGYERAIAKRKIAERRTEEQATGEQATGTQAEATTVERDDRILIDVMHDVSTEDAPLRRLKAVPGLADEYMADGYLLVVDAVAERARSRVEEAFAGSTVTAALVVWRSDEPGPHLARAVEGLAKRMVYEAVVAALEAGLPGWRTIVPPVEQDFELAIVERRAPEGVRTRILVDVMRTVSPQVAPLCRLRAARDGLASMFDADGYLLVVDSVAERSRERIEKAFAKSKLPAELFVWRSDLPSVYMPQAVERLLERIESARQP